MSTEQPTREPSFRAYKWAEIAHAAITGENAPPEHWLDLMQDLCNRCEAEGLPHPYRPETLVRLSEMWQKVETSQSGPDRNSAIVALLAFEDES